MQLARVRLDCPTAQVVRQLSNHQQVPPGRIDRKTPWLGFNRCVALGCETARCGIHREVRQSAGRALAGVQVTPIRRQVQIGCPRFACEARRQNAHGLQQAQAGPIRIPSQHIHRAIEFVKQIHTAALRVKPEMPRTSASTRSPGLSGRQLACVCVEMQDHEFATPQRCGQHIALAR